MSETQRIDRRGFIVAAASAAAVAYVPFGSFAAPAVGATETRELLADWSIDDQWGVVARWDAIPCVPQHADDARLAAVHPADVQFVA
jgi:hypothetical protein